MTPLEALVKNILTLGLLGYLYHLTKHYEKRNVLIPGTMLCLTYLAMFVAFPVKSYGTHFKEEALGTDSSALATDTTPINKPLADTVLTVIEEIVDTKKTTATEDTKKTIASVHKKDSVVAKQEKKIALAYTPRTSIYAGFKNFSDGVTANVDKGTSIVCMLSLECEHCMETAKKIGELNRDQKLPPVYFLFFGSPGELDHFFDVAKCKFPYKIVEPQIFFPLLGDIPSPPRVSVLKEGNIMADFDNDSFSKEKLKKAIE
jgi:hypothetical protein